MTTGNMKQQSPAHQEKSQTTVQSVPLKNRRKLGQVKDLNTQLPPLSITPRLLQRKPAIGEAHDIYEQEADRIASQVMRRPGYSRLKRPDIRVNRVPGPAATNHRQAYTPTIVEEVLKSPGQPLDTSTRTYMEARFGHDFSRVRVHTGERAAASAQAVNAQAYTSGNNVVFGAGYFKPGNLAGTALIAHELAHVLQQDAVFGARQMVQRGWISSMQRGWEMYSGLTDEGAPFARELMRWRIIGLGADFRKTPTDRDWNDFLIGRPEIQRDMATKFRQMAVNFAARGASPSGLFGPNWQTYNDQITGTRLNELESMRLTLHGCYRIEIRGLYRVTQEEGTTTVQMTADFVWIDRADLHPNVATELESGEVVSDTEFSGAGWDYDISIGFHMPSISTWTVSGGNATHVRGWPPVTGAPAAGWRG